MNINKYPDHYEIKTITIGIIALNEHRYLPDLLVDILNQTYPKQLTEVILVDGNSSDATWEIMETFRSTHGTEYRDVRLFKNQKRIQPAGWNIVIKNSACDVVIRIDAHARIPEDFIEKNIECINSGEYVCGGPRENIIDGSTDWEKILLIAEQSMLGSGIALYRRDTSERKYVKSVFHGAYRKEVFKSVGLFNEKLVRTEDNEFHYRIRKAGYRICYDPIIKSYYQTRNSLKEMLRQKYQNGRWIGKTLFLCPGCISAFHLVPVVFVICTIVFAAMMVFGINWPAICLWIIYGTAVLSMTVISAINEKCRNSMLAALPVVFLLLHFSYGFGTGEGICEILINKLRNIK